MRKFVMLLAAGAAMFAIGCGAIPRTRTLPPSIRNVYVPMVVNRSAEPAIEETLTRMFQEEILADGRLDLVQKNRADAIVEVTIRRVDRKGVDFSSDDFATGQRYEVAMTMSVLENIPGRPRIGGERKVSIKYGFNADTRTTTYDPEPDILDRTMREAARALNLELMTGEYQDEDFRPIGTGAATAATP